VDKLRAMHYVARTAETGSFAAAAKSLDVSTPAVSQLVNARVSAKVTLASRYFGTEPFSLETPDTTNAQVSHV